MREPGNAFHLAIPTHDLDAAYAFYVEGLGCHLARRYADRITLDFFGDQVCLPPHRDGRARADRPLSAALRVTFREERDLADLLRLVEIRKLPVFREAALRFEGTVRGAHDGGPARSVGEPAGVQALPRSADDALMLVDLLCGSAGDPDGVPRGARRTDPVLLGTSPPRPARGPPPCPNHAPSSGPPCRADPLDFAACFLGLIAAGSTVAPLDPRLASDRVQDELAEVDATLLVTDRPAAAGVPVLGPWPPASDVQPPGGGHVLLRSSGTTGPRKQILLGEAQLLHTAGAIARHHGLGPGSVASPPLPLFHVNAEVVGLLCRRSWPVPSSCSTTGSTAICGRWRSGTA